MPKVEVYKGDRWPDYCLTEDEKYGIDIPEDLYQRFLLVNEEYGKVQKEIEKYHPFWLEAQKKKWAETIKINYEQT